MSSHAVQNCTAFAESATSGSRRHQLKKRPVMCRTSGWAASRNTGIAPISGRTQAGRAKVRISARTGRGKRAGARVNTAPVHRGGHQLGSPTRQFGREEPPRALSLQASRHS